MSDEVQTVAAPEVQPAVEVEQVSAPVEEVTANTETETQEPEAKPAKTFTQEELDEIVKKRLAKEHRKVERYARAEAEAQMLREQLAQMQKPAEVQTNDAKPEPSQFKTYEEYIDSLTDWKVQKQIEQLNQQTAQKQQMTAAQEYENKLRENLNKGAEKYEDFSDVVSSIPANAITIDMRNAIGESENAADIAYYLGLNPNEASNIAKMSPIAQIRAIDKIGAKLSQEPNQTSNAPAPIKPVTAQAAQRVYDTTDPRSVGSMSTSEWIAAERARQAKKFGKRY